MHSAHTWPISANMLSFGNRAPDGGHIKDRPVTPSDLAATIYRHMGVPLDAVYQDANGRPQFIVADGGRPIEELF